MTPSTRVAAERTASGVDDVPSARVGDGHDVVLAPADGLQLIGEMPGSGYRRPPALVRRADGQTITLSPLLYLTLKAIDGQRDLGAVSRALSVATGRLVLPEDVIHLTEGKLRPLGLLAGPDGSQPQTRKMNPLLALRLKFVVTDQTWTRRLTAPFAWLFNPVVVIPVLAAFLALTWWVLVDKGLGSAVHQAFYEPGMILALWVLIMGSAAFHEFGHAAACKYGGATPGAMGAGLYLVWPAFYTEVTDSYRLGRGGRLRVDLGGLYFNALFALATMGAWVLLRWDALLLVVAAQHLQMVRQMAPFIRADGYHIIADATGVPDLFAHIKPTLQGLLPRRWRPAQPSPLKRWARAVVAVWVLTMVPLLVGLIGLAVLILPRLAATAWDSMSMQWTAAGHYWTESDPLGVGVRLVSALIVCLPVLGILYLLTRIARHTGSKVWKATEGDLRGSAAAALGGAAIIAVVAWAWWPADQYRPIEATDGGSLSELVNVEDRRIFIPLLQRDPAVLRAAPQAASASPALRHPANMAAVGLTSDAPVVSGVTRSGINLVADPAVLATRAVAEEIWPFPFPAPQDPRTGDNIAMAVNTVDDSVLTELAVSWALVTANEVAERNEAWALASCEDCRTLAVAFQVLLLVADHHEVVTPVNAAVAANYECTRCTTEALAVQLVMSLTGVPSEEAQQLIAEAMGRVQMLEAELDDLSGGQIYYLLQLTQAEIVRILEDDGVLPAVLDGSGTTLASQTGDAEPNPVLSSPSATAEETTGSTEDSADGSASDGSPSATTEGGTSEPSPTAEPTSSGTTDAEPSSDPSPEPTATTSSEPSTEPEPQPTEEATQEATVSSEPSPTP